MARLSTAHKRSAIIHQLGNKINAGRKQAALPCTTAATRLAGQYFNRVSRLDVAEISITIDCLRDYAALVLAQDWAALATCLKARVSEGGYPLLTTQDKIDTILDLYKAAFPLVKDIIKTACWDRKDKKASMKYDFGRKSIAYTGRLLTKPVELTMYTRCRRVPKFLQEEGVVAVYRIDLENKPSVYLQAMSDGSVWAFRQD